MSDERQDPQSYLVPGSGVFKSPFVNGGVQSLELHVLHCQYSTISGLCVSNFLSCLITDEAQTAHIQTTTGEPLAMLVSS